MTALPSDVPISYGAQFGFDDGVENQRFGDNYSAFVQRGENAVRGKWQIGWSGISATDEWTLRNFFRTLGTDYFTWVPPGEPDGTYKWRPVRNSYSATHAQYENYNVTINVEQVFDP
jgi:phage-related protein